MPNHIRHFAITADDVERARGFYEAAFGWRFTPYGPPNFYQIDTGGGLPGALQQRAEPLGGAGLRGFECTIGVDDLDDAIAGVGRHGGRMLSAPFTIPGVGRLAFFADTEGNRVGVMQYEASHDH